MKKLKFKLFTAILSFFVGISGVMVSKILFPPVFSSTQQKFSKEISLPQIASPSIQQNLDTIDIHPDQISDNKTDLGVFDPSGDYHPTNRPAEEEFIQFDLKVRRKKGQLIAWGEVRGVQPWYKFTSVFVTEKQLKFSTVEIDGVSYDFDGKFIGKGDFANQSFGIGIVMLKGTLRKFVNGKKVMEINTSFKYYAGC